MVKQTEAIARFLQSSTHPDLAAMYNAGMEVQVNVAKGKGERIEGEYLGKKWQGWTDGIETWKAIRIPYKANSEPEYTDKELKFNLEKHVEGIGMTGWDWSNKVSKWVAYDFDSISGHSEKHVKKLTDQEIADLIKAVSEVPWVTVRKSTGGNGLHLYVFLDDVPTANHTEHAALARAILGKLSALVGVNFEAKVDTCGGNMWVWHRKMRGTPGLSLIKAGEILYEIPDNWTAHMSVVSGRTKKVVPKFVEESEVEGVDKLFNELCGQVTKNNFEEDHKRLIAWLEGSNCGWWWDADHNMLITHTASLKKAHSDLGFRGVYDTLAKGTESNDHNCFAFPIRKGGWVVRRYTRGVAEAPCWEQDGAGWTRCYYNSLPDLATACRTFGGIEHKTGGFVFDSAEMAEQSANLLGVQLKVPPELRSRKTKLKEHKDGRLVAEIAKGDEDGNVKGMEDWLKEDKTFAKIFNGTVHKRTDQDVGNYDDVLRHLVSPCNEDYGWVIKGDGEWRDEPLVHVKHYLSSLGLSPKEVGTIVGSAVVRAWKVVSLPFQPEYVGDRIWNRSAPQYKVSRKEDREGLSYPTWQKLLHHCGRGLDETIRENEWCRSNNILTGADYLKIWLGSLLQHPTEPLPYLFFFGPQNSGKSIFHEAVELLITSGICRADISLISTSGFNAELKDSIVCVVEELDLRTSKVAYNRIKDWVTARTISIHEKGETPYTTNNNTHWIQCANDIKYCPVFPGDTRITMCYVPELDPLDMIPKRVLLPMLQKEASDFLTEALSIEIPESNDRLNVPVIATQDKLDAETDKLNLVELFIKEACHAVDGEIVLLSEFHQKFYDWLPTEEQGDPKYTKRNFSKLLPRRHPKGRRRSDANLCIGNVSFTQMPATRPLIVLKGDYLDHAS